jgi:hypothetical protein
MKINGFLYVALLLAAVVAGSGASFAASTGEMLQQGLYAEEVEGNPDAAFKIYTQITENRSAPPNHAAQALYRMAVCCVKTNDAATARKLVAKLVANYPGEKEVVEKANALLDGLSDFDPAALMPPGTIAYVEFGSPGHQVETILGALKGTPYENPLAVVGMAQAHHPDAGWKTPADLVGALLNPSMVTEFKKVHSLAIGITGLALENPSMVAVLHPGKSDALRGLVVAGLAMVGTQAEPIEGMQTVKIRLSDDKAIAAAYDDRIVIASLPADQLPWCVKPYKGSMNEPSLASANSSFAKLDRTQRRKNALTVWANVGEYYGQLMKLIPPGKVPPGLISANAIVDFANIDNLTLTESIATGGAATRAEIQFKDGHRCLAFDLVRTPNLTKAGLEAVPPQAVGLASFSLNQSAPANTETIRAQVRNITGLDIGRELFVNIEEVTVFAMPAGESSTGSTAREFIPGRLGLALTSRDPEQTRQVLTTLLSTASMGSATQQSAGATQFRIGKNGGADLYCFLEQVNRTTVLSLDRAVLDASVSSLRSHESALTSGSLKGALDNLSPNASKLILVNAGGAVRLVGPQIKPAPFNEEQAGQFRDSLERLAQALDKTVIELRTEEHLDSLALDSRVRGIPPLNQVVGPATEIAHLVEDARGEATTVNLRQQTPALIMPAPKAPVIDGTVDEAWSRAPRYKLENELKTVSSGEKLVPIKSPEDLSADFRALWDEKNLYVLVDVTDDKLVSDTDPNNPVMLPSGSRNIPWWWDDSVEVYLDADNAKATEYGKHDALFRFNWGPKPAMRVYNRNVETHIDGVEYAMVRTEKGYRLEASFPWEAFAVKPSAGATVGLDVHVNDDDDGGPRDHKITWHDTSDQAYRSPRVFGNGVLAGLVGWWKFDEGEGTIAKDSSGFGHDGKLNGNARWTTGKAGGAVQLDGKGSFVSIADRSAFNMGGKVTVAGWVNVHAVPSEWMAIVTKGDNAWRLSMYEKERRFHFSVNDWNRLELNGSIAVEADTWHHVAGVYDGQEVRLYIDGKLDTKQPWTGGIGRNNAEVLIGENAERRGRCFDGMMEDVRVYNYALSDNEIKALATSQVAAR